MAAVKPTAVPTRNHAMRFVARSSAVSVGSVVCSDIVFSGTSHILRYSEAMAQDPEQDEHELQNVDPSHELDLVTLFSSSNIDAEMEATTIHNLLQAGGVPSVVVGASTIPSLEFQVQV